MMAMAVVVVVLGVLAVGVEKVIQDARDRERLRRVRIRQHRGGAAQGPHRRSEPFA